MTSVTRWILTTPPLNVWFKSFERITLVYINTVSNPKSIHIDCDHEIQSNEIPLHPISPHRTILPSIYSSISHLLIHLLSSIMTCFHRIYLPLPNLLPNLKYSNIFQSI